ncbi:hypothetical protein MMC30_002296 [Trapelia coarctata]|nr:hypothetical protein [Trapelia coarctata]
MSTVTSGSSTSLTRYRPAILLVTALAAGYSIYYVHNNIWSTKPPPPQPLVRRNAVHRRHHRRRVGDQRQAITSERALDLYRSAASQSYGGYTTEIEGLVIEIPISLTSRLSPAELARQFNLSEEASISVAQARDTVLLQAVLSSVLPLHSRLEDPGGVEAFLEAFAQEGFSTHAITRTISRFNTGALEDYPWRRALRDAEASRAPAISSEDTLSPPADDEAIRSALPRLDDGDSGSPASGTLNRPGTAADGESLQSWQGGDENEESKKEGQSLLSLLYHIAEDQARRDGYVHRGVSCNSCNIKPIRGIRFRCANCMDFDLCEQCEAMQIHPKTHVFYKVRIPAPFSSNPRHIQPVWYPGKPAGLPQNVPREANKRFCTLAGLESAEVDALWDQFKCLAGTEWAEDPDELGIAIDRLTFNKCYTANTSTRPSRPNLVHDRMFALYDSNSDGLIGFSEFIVGLSSIKSKNPKEKMKQVFQGYDLDRDGYVSRRDMLRMFRATYALTKEITREMIAGMEDDAMEVGGQRDLVASSQPISSAFGGTIPPGEPSRIGEGKRQTIHGDYIPIDDGIIGESNQDGGDYHEVVADISEKSIFGHVTRERRATESLPIDAVDGPDDTTQGEDDISQVRTETVFDDPEIRNLMRRRWPDDGPVPREEEETSEEVAGASDQAEARNIAERQQAKSLTKLRESVRNQSVDERWRRRQFYLAEEDGVPAPVSSRENKEPSMNGHLKPTDPIKARNTAVKYIRDSSSFRSFRLSIEDEMNRRHWDTGDETETRSIADMLVHMAGLSYEPKVMVSNLEQLGLDQAWSFIDWFLIHIAVTEKDLKDRPVVTSHGQSYRPTKRSRSSSKVRFEDDLTDGELETRSNTSMSSRSIPVGERWGAYEVPEPEKDLGQEYLYQITQESLNELLDPVFRQREDLAMEVLSTAKERKRFRSYTRNWSTPGKLKLIEPQLRRYQKAWRSSDTVLMPAFSSIVAEDLRNTLRSQLDPGATEYNDNIADMRSLGLIDASVDDPGLLHSKLWEFLTEETNLESNTKGAEDISMGKMRKPAEVGATSDSEHQKGGSDVVTPSVTHGPASVGEQKNSNSNGYPPDGSNEAAAPQLAMDLEETVAIFNEADPSVEDNILQTPLEDLLQQSGYELVGEPSKISDRIDPTLPQNRPFTTPYSPSSFSPPTTASPAPKTADTTPPANEAAKPKADPTSPELIPALKKIILHDEATQVQFKFFAMMDYIEKEDEERGGPGRINFGEFEEIMTGPRGPRLAFVGSWIHLASFWGSSI